MYRQMVARAKKPALRAQWEPHPKWEERYYRNAQMPTFDGSASRVRPVTLSADYVGLLKQIEKCVLAGQRFLKDLDRKRNR